MLILGKLSLTTKFSWTINQRGHCDLRVCACAGVCILEILFSRWKYLVKCLKLSRCCKNMTTLHSSPNKLTRGRFTKQENIWIGRVFQKQSNERLIATRVKKVLCNKRVQLSNGSYFIIYPVTSFYSSYKTLHNVGSKFGNFLILLAPNKTHFGIFFWLSCIFFYSLLILKASVSPLFYTYMILYIICNFYCIVYILHWTHCVWTFLYTIYTRTFLHYIYIYIPFLTSFYILFLFLLLSSNTVLQLK